MKILFILQFIICVSFMNFGCGSAGNTEVQKEIYVWSHNDYEQNKPLTKALAHGYQMIEVDIHLINGELYVSHDYPDNLDDTPKLEAFYLKPLAKIIDENGGVVIPNSNLPFYLAIDIKSEAIETFEKLSEAIKPYQNYFKRKVDGKWIDGPMKLLISGNRPDLNPDSPDRVAFLDGRIKDIGKSLSTELYPIISDNWFNFFSWDGDGNIPEHELTKLRNFVELIHSEGKILRFWATPDREEVWEVLIDENVDVINVDDLNGIGKYLFGRKINMHLLSIN